MMSYPNDAKGAAQFKPATNSSAANGINAAKDTTNQQPKPAASLAAQRQLDVFKYAQDIYYSDRYDDDSHEYRHVSIPERLRRYLPHPPRIMTETEWRSLGVQQSAGWVHYMVHDPEPHMLLFKRTKGQ
ncbi:hypothetical protein LPJ73_000208 [Coemansia sp. RSA 2703]|nr:hypothetical protein LPJ73_000208 [Coemansia sp. RSA 2703]KAJ2372449.1 hypothetical protein IW150_004109 [Coemansia sp. RSA 2607]KAJ2398118.1 hypothetical protein GGI05_000283 [Coemansia sp. RSA 2603]